MSNARDKANIPALNFSSTGIDDNATSTAITIDSSQNVGIGTSSPTAALEVSGSNNANNLIVGYNNTDFAVYTDGTVGEIRLKAEDGSGSNFSKYMTFYTNPSGSAATERMRIDSSGDVGIGHSSPNSKLEISKINDGTEFEGLLLRNNAISSGTTTVLRFINSTNNTSVENGGFIKLIRNASNDNDLTFGTVNAERMRIDSSGKVGIGTSSPGATLHIVGTSNFSTEFKVGNSSWNASNSNAGLLHQYASSTGYSELQINSVATSPSSAFTVRNSTGVAMNFTNDGASTFNGKLTVNDTIKTQTISNRSALQGINPTPNDGNNFELGAGFLNLFRDDTVTVKTILFGKNGSEVGNITTTGSTTAYNTSSDYRLKENVVEMTNATNRLKQLKPKRFNFISNSNTTVDGFLAHEVSSVVPEAVTGTHNEVKTWKEHEELPEGVSVGDNKLDENGNTIPEYQGIDQSKLVPLLVKTIQELEARITTLENK